MSDQQDIKLIEELIERLTHTPVYIQFTTGISMPYALNNGIDDTTVEVENNTITLYSLIADEYDTFDISLVESFATKWIDPDAKPPVFDVDSTLEDIEHDKKQIAMCVEDESIELSTPEIIATRCVYGQTECEWRLLKRFGLRYTMHQLRHPTEEMMQEMRTQYMDLIRSHRSKSFEELDVLEQEIKTAGGDDQDLDDIDSIKQMFRDIPQETDLSKYKNLQELYEFWPSLMLPKPQDLLELDELAALDQQDEDDDMYDELTKILNNIQNPHEINRFRASLGNLDNIDPVIVKKLRFREKELKSKMHLY